MTDREVIQQALEAYDKHEPLAVVMEELRTALEQPDRQTLQAAGTHPAPCARHCEAKAFELEIRSLKSALRAALEQPEPVTHLHEWFRTGAMEPGKMRCIHCGAWGNDVSLTTPPAAQRKPLTDEEIAAIVRVAAKGSAIKRDGSTSQRIARAIEAAHGIKEGT